MTRRVLGVLALLVASQLASGCCFCRPFFWCHRPFWHGGDCVGYGAGYGGGFGGCGYGCNDAWATFYSHPGAAPPLAPAVIPLTPVPAPTPASPAGPQMPLANPLTRR